MLNHKRNMLSAALASALIAMAAGAHAQAAQDTEEEAAAKAAAEEEAKSLDAVVVTGIRAGIENAIETKQSSTSIV